MSALPIEPSNHVGREQAAVQVLHQVSETAALPQVVYKILELAGNDDAGVPELEKAIIVDPGFSVKVLACSNSAYYGLPRKVTSIREAVMFLGFKAVRQLAMTVGVFDLFVGKSDAESLRRRGWWRHSLDTAIGARWLAQRTDRCVPDEAYTCGLVHWIGKTLLDRYDPAAYESVALGLAEGLPDLEAETRAYGCDHILLAQLACRKWGFPEVLVQGINYASEPTESNPASSLNAVVAIASRIADVTASKNVPEEGTTFLFPQWALNAFGLSEPEEVDPLVLACIDHVNESAKLSL